MQHETVSPYYTPTRWRTGADSCSGCYTILQNHIVFTTNYTVYLSTCSLHFMSLTTLIFLLSRLLYLYLTTFITLFFYKFSKLFSSVYLHNLICTSAELKEIKSTRILLIVRFLCTISWCFNIPFQLLIHVLHAHVIQLNCTTFESVRGARSCWITGPESLIPS